MSDNHPTVLYGVVGQPLTQDYLARQLPIFQQKVPSSQVGLILAFWSHDHELDPMTPKV